MPLPRGLHGISGASSSIPFERPLCRILALGGHEWSPEEEKEEKKKELPPSQQLKLRVCFPAAFKRTLHNPPSSGLVCLSLRHDDQGDVTERGSRPERGAGLPGQGV